jgi:hypothetical protein
MVWERLDEPARSYVWQTLGDFRGDGIDARQEATDFLTKHGHELFVRRPTEQKCSCADTTGAFREFDVRCPTCSGFGYVYHDTKVRSYNRPAFGTFGFTGGAVQTSLGDVHAGDLVFYMPYDEPAVVGHHLVEVTTDDDGLATQPYIIERLYEIKIAHAFRDRRGRIEYWATLARELTLSK